VGLRIPRSGGHTFLGQIDGLRERALELRVEIRRGFLHLDAGPREASQVVIDRHGTAAKQDVEPDGRCERPMVGGIAGIYRDGLSQQAQCLIVVQVIGKVGCALPQFVPGLRRDYAHGYCQGQDDGKWQPDGWLVPRHQTMIARL